MKKKYKLLLAILIVAMSFAVWSQTMTFKTNVTGLTGPALENAQNAVKVAEGKLAYPLTKDILNDFSQTAPKVIKKALEPFGYFRSTVTPMVTTQNHQWVINFHINPGPVVQVTSVDVTLLGQGQEDPDFLRLLKKLPLQTGVPLNIAKYNQAKQMLFNYASQRGYFKAKMKKNKIIINLKNYTAKIVIKFHTGPRYRFGETTFSELPLSRHFLGKFLLYHEGEYYDYRLVNETQENLVNSDYFDVVTVNPKTHQAKNNIVPIHIHIVPRPAKQYIFGLGYGTDTGPRATLGIDLRRVNAYGHRFNTLLLAATKNSSLIANYFIPGPNPARDLFAISAAVGSLDINIGSSRSAKFAISYTAQYGLLKQNIALTYLNENYNIFDLPRTRARLIYPSINWSYLNADNDVKPSKGISLALSLAGTPFSLNKDMSDGFFQVYAQIRTLYTLPIHMRLLLRTAAGRTLINNIFNLPLSLQLLTGGADSVRGYSFNSIGPGKNLVLGSFEVQQRVYGNWYIAGFIDAGNVSNDNPFQDIRIGTGPAIMWLSPVGAIELSVARTFNLQKNRWRVQFTMGPQL